MSAQPPRGLLLVVDDDDDVRNITERILRSRGFDVLAAGGGAEALELYASRGDEIDLVLLDMTMPDVSGVEVFLEVRAMQPDAKVILTSGFGERRTAERLEEHGVTAFLKKPYRSAVLVEAVQTALA